MLKSIKAIEFIEKWLIRGEIVLCPDSDQKQVDQIYWLLKRRFWDDLQDEDKGILSVFSILAKAIPKWDETLCEKIFHDEWPKKKKIIDNYIDFIIKKEENYSIVSYEILDTYRDFIISQLDDTQKRAINQRLVPIYKIYPQIGIEYFIKIGDLESIKDIHPNIFNELEKTYRYEDIIKMGESIIKLIEDPHYSDFKFYYDILTEIGKASYFLGYFKKSIEYYQKALKIAIDKKCVESTSYAYGWIGVACFNLGQYTEAINFLQQAINIAKIFKEDERLIGFWLGCRANAVRDSGLLGSKELSVGLYDEPLAIARKTSDRENESRWFANKGNAIRDLGNSIEAREYYVRALEIAEEIKNKHLQGRWLHNIGCTYDDCGEYEKGIEYHEKAQKISHDCGDNHNEGNCFASLGWAYNKLGQFEKAIDYYKKALKITIECKDMVRAKNHIKGLINAFKNANRLEGIVEYLRENLNAAKTRGDQEDKCFWSSYLGYVFQDLGQLEEARNNYKQAYEIAKSLKDSKYERSLINMLDEVSLLEVENFYDSGLMENAFQKCNDLIIEIIGRGFKEMIKQLSEVWRIEYPLDALNNEIETYRNEIENNPLDSDLHMKLADCYARKGDLADAIFEYKKAIELNPSNIIALLSMMEVTIWRRQYTKAIKIYQKWSKKITSPDHKVIATWIVCTALTLDGKAYENYIGPLLDMEINLSETHYSSKDILPYFLKLLEDGFQIARLINAWELHNLFTRHFVSTTLDDTVKVLPQGIPNELTEILMEVFKVTVPSIDSPLLKAYMKRGLIYRMLGNINMAIKDYITAIIYSPNNDEAYMAGGACLAQKNELEKALPKYVKAIELNPGNKMAILGKMEVEICMGRYDEAITTYERLKEATFTPQEEIIVAFLLCLSLALQGKSYEDHIDPLRNLEVKLSEKQDWCNVEIDRHLTELEKSGFNSVRVTQAKEIQDLFKKHFVV